MSLLFLVHIGLLVTETYYEYDQVNTNKPIWTRNSKDITEEEYKTFYKNFSNDWQDYIMKHHFTVEGNYEFTVLLYIPHKDKMAMFNPNRKNNNIKLHVRRVFITDECKELVPEYMVEFLKGIVDSNDLPLNVSREMLQENKIIGIIRKQIVKKVLTLLLNTAKDEPETYMTFYKEFSKNIKLGVHDDSKNKDKLVKLLRFKSSNNTDKLISFDDYIKDMKEGQTDIYYITGDSIKSIINSPYMEQLKSKGYNVFTMDEPIDEYVMRQLTEYEGKKLINISKAGLDLDDVSKEDKEKMDKDYEPLFKLIKDTLHIHL
jgi:molecular chaperone HtpG